MILDVIPEEYKKFMIEKIFSNPEIKDCLKENDVEGAIEIIKSFPNKFFEDIKSVYSYVAEIETPNVMSSGTWFPFCNCIKIKEGPIPEPRWKPWPEYRINLGMSLTNNKAREAVITILQKMIEEAN